MNTRQKQHSLHDRFVQELAAGVGLSNENLKGCSEDEARRELLAWASRLEFESMDLREKAKVLSVQLLKNSDLLQDTSNSMNDNLLSLQQTTVEPIQELCTSLKKVNDSIKSTNMLLGKQRKQLEDDVVLNGYSETIQMLRSISSQLDQIQNQRSHAVVSNNSSSFNNFNTKLETMLTKFQSQNMKFNKEVMDKFNKIEQNSKKFQKSITDLQHSHNNLSEELKSSAKPVQNHTPITPNSSLLTTSTIDIPVRITPRPSGRITKTSARLKVGTPLSDPDKLIYKSRSSPANKIVKPVQHPRKILETSDIANVLSQEEFRCISLLSDDLIDDI